MSGSTPASRPIAAFVPRQRLQSIAAYSGQVYAFCKQHVHQAYQWQADQAGGVIAFCALKQAHTKAFGFKAASAVVGLFCEQIEFDLFGT